MDPARFTRIDQTTWQIEPTGAMRVPGIIYADEDLIRAMDDKVYEQTVNVATLPGIMKAVYVMPDAHWGYGFPIGGVAAFDADEGGVISAGGVGFDVSCGVRTMLSRLKVSDIAPVQKQLAESLYQQIPAGLGSKGAITLDPFEMDAMLKGGARWAIERGWGETSDLERIEERGQMAGAEPSWVSNRAKERQRREMGTLGSGNHYLEVQAVTEIFDEEAAASFGLKQEEVVVTIHCGSRGLGHQIGTEYLRDMLPAAAAAGIALPDRELACAPITSEVGQRYLGAMRAAVNCALANREIIGHYARRVFSHFFPNTRPHAAFRRVAQHLQGRNPQGRRCQPPAVRASQGCDTGVRSEPFRSARGSPQDRSARPHRRQHGNGVLRTGRLSEQRGEVVCLGLPWGGAGDVSSCRAQGVERAPDRR